MLIVFPSVLLSVSWLNSLGHCVVPVTCEVTCTSGDSGVNTLGIPVLCPPLTSCPYTMNLPHSSCSSTTSCIKIKLSDNTTPVSYPPCHITMAKSAGSFQVDRQLPFKKLRITSIIEMAMRPLVVPEPFTGEGSWDHWIDHFESVAAFTKWNAEDKLLWLQVRMTGREQKSYKNLSGEAKSRYELCKKGLQEPGSRKELYLFELHARTKHKTEDWPSFAEDIKSLAERAFANFEETAEEHLTLTHYLGQLDNLQVAFSVKQKHSKTVDEALQEPTPPKNGRNPQSLQQAKGGASAEKTSTGARKHSFASSV